MKTKMEMEMEMKGGRVRKEKEVVTRWALQNEFWYLVGRHGMIESGGVGTRTFVDKSVAKKEKKLGCDAVGAAGGTY